MWLHDNWMMWHGWGWFMPFGSVWFLVLMAVLIAMLFSRSPRRYPPHRSTALDLLEQRYARGEIGRDEYLEKKRDLQGGV